MSFFSPDLKLQSETTLSEGSGCNLRGFDHPVDNQSSSFSVYTLCFVAPTAKEMIYGCGCEHKSLVIL